MSKTKTETKTDNKNKYSHTVLLPKTEFPMRAGLAKKEPQTLA